jgi:signal peptidase I
MSTVPKRGDIVTFTYETYSRRDVPVNPKLLRVRKDVSWESIVVDHIRSTPQPQPLSGMQHER